MSTAIFDAKLYASFKGFGGKRALGILRKIELCQKRFKFRMQFCLGVLRAVCCKDQLMSCNIEKTDFPNFCQNKGLGELVLKI